MAKRVCKLVAIVEEGAVGAHFSVSEVPGVSDGDWLQGPADPGPVLPDKVLCVIIPGDRDKVPVIRCVGVERRVHLVAADDGSDGFSFPRCAFGACGWR